MSKINEIKVNITTIGYDSAKAKLNDIEEQQDRILYKQKLIGGMESNVIKHIEGLTDALSIDKIAEELRYYISKRGIQAGR